MRINEIKSDQQHTKDPLKQKLVDGSYLLTIYGLQSGKLDLQFANDEKPTMWFESSSSQFQLYLDGYFYLESTTSIEPQENLDRLLQLLESKSLSAIERELAGGMFNLFILDKKTSSLDILNDRMGLLPLFYHQSEWDLVISNNQFNFREFSQVSPSAVFEFLKFGYLPVSPSLFNQVERTRGGSRYFIDLNSPVFLHFPANQNQSESQNKPDLSEWVDAFDAYFNRLQDKNLMMGISGGYDSRWLAAYTQYSNPALLNFGAAKSSESQIAHSVAHKLDLPFQNESFPTDAISRYASVLRSQFKTITSLENVHVLHLSKRVEEHAPDLYLDGYLGDVILGDTYFSNIKGSLRSLIAYLFAKPQFDEPRKELTNYEHHLYECDKQGLADEILGPVNDQTTAADLKLAIKDWIETLPTEGADHFEFLERLKLHTRGRNLISNGPVSIQQHTQVLLPFMDYRIMDLAQRTPKSERFANRLYNQLWKHRFPGLSRIRKAGSFGTAADHPFLYRLKSLLFVLKKKVQLNLPMLKQNQAEEQYFSLEEYLADPQSKRLIKNLILAKNSHIPEDIQQAFRDEEIDDKNPALLLRYVSLLIYLGD